ncbi:MAG: flavin reductase family protein [Xanthobacteraceae bacterium]|nr:flavin reductase family protein [Xanthobacteraceae bacterium]
MNAPHIVSEPPILYFGTPVVLISSANEDGSANLAPMSSAFWLGWRCILGLNASSKTTENMIRTGQCVLNLPSVDNVAAVNRLACLTGSNPVPAVKLARGYTYEKRKFETAGLTAIPSLTVAPPRALECPVQMEAVVAARHDLLEDDDAARGKIVTFEVRVTRVHIHPDIAMDGVCNRVDPDKWRPLIMSFQRYYGLGEELHESTLAKIPEEIYRMPDIARSRTAELVKS